MTTSSSSNSNNNTTSASLTQKLQKMESSALRAACRHMLSLDPEARLSAGNYLERLQEQCVELRECRKILDKLYRLLESLQRMDTPDARIHALYQAYPDVLFETMGIRAELPDSCTTAAAMEDSKEKWEKPKDGDRSDSPSDLWTETQELLKELEAASLDFEVSPTRTNVASQKTKDSDTLDDSADKNKTAEPRTPLEESCLLIYVQQILSIVRHVQRPATKQVALSLIQQLSHRVSDETRLQRIVPVVLALLKDSDSLVRASALHTVTKTLVMLQSFPPSDAQVMPQYIFKRVAPLLTDSSLAVRLALAQNMGGLAETAHRFLDISHAVRLVQAVEGGGAGTSATSANASGAQTPIPGGVPPSEDKDIFEEKVTQLLDAAPAGVGESSAGTTSNKTAAPKPGTVLIRSTYQAEHDALAETLSRWVVHVCTDQSENASMVKRALLSHALEGLCSFFSLEGVMAFILPQLLAFLNDRQDWQLRSALFAGLPTVCRIIGKGASQEFVLPCIETGLVDSEEQVITQALSCLSSLIEQGLLSKALVVSDNTSSLLDRYSGFLIHPSKSVRRAWICVVCATSRALGSPDCVIYVAPVLFPFVRFRPSWKQLSSESEMVTCLKSPWNRKRFNKELARAASNRNTPWTAIGVVSSGVERATAGLEGGKLSKPEQEPMIEKMQSYLQMLARHNTQTDSTSSHLRTLDHIEGSLKLAQSVVFPRRSNKPLPDWYRDLREKAEKEDSEITEASAIRSVSALGSVYGLSIMGEGSTDVISAAEVPDDLKHERDFLGSDDSKEMELAFMGKWESEVTLDPEVVDTALLATKLRALKVPTLPPMGGHITYGGMHGTTRSPREVADWKPRVNSVIASSSTIGGHTAPVVRLAVASDSSFFVSASHDGTCAVWEVPQLEQSSGFLEPSTLYRGHMSGGPTRVNDVSMVEGTYSVVSGASNGAVHAWRVELVSSPAKATTAALERRERSRVVGASSIREVDPAEGEVLAVSHFSSVSSSVVAYATQKGTVRTWDLRSSEEPLSLPHGPKLGHLSSMALGGDRNWIVTGTSRGFIALWDVRFQQPFKLWRHNRGEKINRLAASFVPPPQTWGTANAAPSGSRPYVFVGSPSNECSMFDVVNGSCVQCFRSVPGVDTLRGGESMPSLIDVSGRTRLRNGVLSVHDEGFAVPRKSFSPTMNCMVGSIQSGNSFLLTGASDGCVRFWDFVSPARCYIVSGAVSNSHPRPTYERIDFDTRRLILCRQFSNTSRKLSNGTQGPKKPDFSIEDIKILDKRALVSASRDCTVKVYR
mmetsp:Transcript_21357/g.59171  ORF Transcript_21357/g.59171 Transcript_21357/m.59171 type:complete len:1292 (-) Transcript_21357:4085-7960(-)